MFELATAWAEHRNEHAGLSRRRTEAARKLEEAEQHLARFVEEEQEALAVAAASVTSVERGRAAGQLDAARERRAKTGSTLERLRAALDRCDRDLGSEERRPLMVERCLVVARLLRAEGTAELEARLLERAGVSAGVAVDPLPDVDPALLLARWNERFRALNQHRFIVRAFGRQSSVASQELDQSPRDLVGAPGATLSQIGCPEPSPDCLAVHQTRSAMLVRRRTRPRRSLRWPLAGAVATLIGAALWLTMSARAPASRLPSGPEAPSADRGAGMTLQDRVTVEGYGVALQTGPYETAPRELAVARSEAWIFEWSNRHEVNVEMQAALIVRGAYRPLGGAAAWRELRFSVSGARRARPVFREVVTGSHEVLIEYDAPNSRRQDRFRLDTKQLSGQSFYRLTSIAALPESRTDPAASVAGEVGEDYAPAHPSVPYPEASDEAWVPPGETWRIEWSARKSFTVSDRSGMAVTASYRTHGSAAPWVPVRWQVTPRERVARAVFAPDLRPGAYEVDAWMTDAWANGRAEQLGLEVGDLPEGRRYRYFLRKGAGPAFRPAGDAPVGYAAPFDGPHANAALSLGVPANVKWIVRWDRGTHDGLVLAATATFTASVHPIGRRAGGAEVRWQSLPDQRVARAIFPHLSAGDYSVEVSGRDAQGTWTGAMPLEVVSAGGHTYHRFGAMSGDRRGGSFERLALPPVR